MPDKRPSDYRAQWEALKQEEAALAAEGKALRGLLPQTAKIAEQEARVAALVVSQDAVAHAAWEATARDLDDVLMLGEIAWSYWWGLGTFPALPADIETKGQDVIAIAYLVRGIADVAQAQAAASGAPAPANENTPARSAAVRLLEQWRATVPEEIVAFEAANDEPPGGEANRSYRALLERMRGLAQAAWALPASGWVDIRLRAEIVHHALYADYYGDGTKRFEGVLTGQEQAEQLTLGTFDERAVAELVKAVLWAGSTGPAPGAQPLDATLKVPRKRD
jgi:hypothetical protein